MPIDVIVSFVAVSKVKQIAQIIGELLIVKLIGEDDVGMNEDELVARGNLAAMNSYRWIIAIDCSNLLDEAFVFGFDLEVYRLVKTDCIDFHSLHLIRIRQTSIFQLSTGLVGPIVITPTLGPPKILMTLATFGTDPKVIWFQA